MLILTDENFEREIKNAEKPFLVDFWTEWCFPCNILTPILEKLSEEYNKKIIFAKVNLDTTPLTAQKYSIDQIPTVILFKNGKPISGFIGVRTEFQIKEWLGNILKENIDSPTGEEKLEKLIRESEEYAKRNGFKLNQNREIVERIVKGLLENEKKYGQKYCPCRRISGNSAEDEIKICPCHWHKEEIEKIGHCFCGLFVK